MHKQSVHPLRTLALTSVLAASICLLAACEGSSPMGLADDDGGAARLDRIALTQICHIKGNGDFESIAVAPSAVESHVRHGDNRTFNGTWSFYGATAAFVTAGATLNGTFLGQWAGRPDFTGTFGDGCTASVTFPDDATYQARLVSACKLQWSVANGTEDEPWNFWIKENCVE